jgi:hypothetical protein
MITVPIPAAETSVGLGMTGGFTDNLFSDSGSIHDSYTTPYVSFNLYPSSSVELAANASYTAYRQVPDLGSYMVGGSVSYIKSDDARPFSFFTSGEISTRRYGELYRDYDNIHAGASLTARYRIGTQVFLKAGAALSSNEYINAATGSNRGYGVFAGLTTTLPGSNSLDIEAGYDLTQFPNLTGDVSRRQIMRTVDPTAEKNLRTFYYSFRWSRPLASHTGIGLSYAARQFAGDNNAVTYGLTLDNLSPWTAFWEGQAMSADIKSYILPNFIMTSSAEYRDISFMDALETSGDESYVRARADRRTTVSLSVARPIVIQPGTILQPTVVGGYIANNSTDPMYDYDTFSVSVTLGMQF